MRLLKWLYVVAVIGLAALALLSLPWLWDWAFNHGAFLQFWLPPVGR